MYEGRSHHSQAKPAFTEHVYCRCGEAEYLFVNIWLKVICIHQSQETGGGGASLSRAISETYQYAYGVLGTGELHVLEEFNLSRFWCKLIQSNSWVVGTRRKRKHSIHDERETKVSGWQIYFTSKRAQYILSQFGPSPETIQG